MCGTGFSAFLFFKETKSRAQPGMAVPLEFEEFAEAFGLLAGDGDFGGFFVVHF